MTSRKYVRNVQIRVEDLISCTVDNSIKFDGEILLTLYKNLEGKKIEFSSKFRQTSQKDKR